MCSVPRLPSFALIGKSHAHATSSGLSMLWCPPRTESQFGEPKWSSFLVSREARCGVLNGGTPNATGKNICQLDGTAKRLLETQESQDPLIWPSYPRRTENNCFHRECYCNVDLDFHLRQVAIIDDDFFVSPRPYIYLGTLVNKPPRTSSEAECVVLLIMTT